MESHYTKESITSENFRLNEYTGYVPPPGDPEPIEEADPNISPQEFFEKYISQRKPVLIKGHLTDKEWKGFAWTNKYLKSRALAAEVIVERRGSDKSATFGLAAPKEEMKYGEFIDNLVADNDRLYLTTQDLERFEEDLDMFDMPKSVVAEPLKSLQGDFPLKPKLFGKLVPYQISLWQGIAKEGTSSGLHHDFHDNLYVLIRGKKRFRLFPPSGASQMKTVGIVSKIHRNGLIVYKSGPKDTSIHVRPDGVPYAFMAKMKREFAEAELTEAEEQLKDLMDDPPPEMTDEERQTEIKRLQEHMAECEQRIDLAMEEMLDCESVSDAESHCSENLEDEPKAKRARTDSRSESASDHHHHHHHHHNPELVQVDYNDQRILPDNFCDIKLPTDTNNADEVFKSCPQLKEVGSIHCEISAGQMLYLPASWFHEVTSYSMQANTNPEDSSTDKGHLALNYWMFPPDNPQFDLPYWDDFWERRWSMLLEEAEAGSHRFNHLEEKSSDSHPTEGAHS